MPLKLKKIYIKTRTAQSSVTANRKKRKASSSLEGASKKSKRYTPAPRKEPTAQLLGRRGEAPTQGVDTPPGRSCTPCGRRTNRTVFYDPDYQPAFDSEDARHALRLSAELLKISDEHVVPVLRVEAPSTDAAPSEPTRTSLLDGREGDILRVILDRAAVYGLRVLRDLKDILNLKDESTVSDLAIYVHLVSVCTLFVSQTRL